MPAARAGQFSKTTAVMDRKVDHHYPIWLLHAICLLACAAIIVIGVILATREQRQAWRGFQRHGLRILESAMAHDAKSGRMTPQGECISFGTQKLPLAVMDDEPLAMTIGRMHELILPDLPHRLGPVESPRRERCMTCHVLIDWTGDTLSVSDSSSQDRGPIWTRPTRVSEPISEVFPLETILEIVLPVVITGKAGDGVPSNREEKADTSLTFGFSWVEPGLLKGDEPRIGTVLRGSPADSAGLRPGDLICAIGNSPVETKDQAETLLSESVRQLKGLSQDLKGDFVKTYYPAPFGSGESVPGIAIKVRRGLPQPWAGHPHPELYVAERSPHPVRRFGCTICHDGQGLALDYRQAEHPSPIVEGSSLGKRCYGYAINVRESIEPMILTELAESRCLRCHDRAFDLAETDIRWEPIAKHLVEGRRLVEKFGCFSCHEMQRDSAPGEPQLGPVSPATEIAEELLALSSTPQELKEIAVRFLETPNDKELLERLRKETTRWQDLLESDTRRFPEDREIFVTRQQVRQLVGALQAANVISGGWSKVGPSLRYVASKLAPKTIERVISEPQSVRPESRMPQIFGLTDHLSEGPAQHRKQFEQVEIAGIVAYLAGQSHPLPSNRTETRAPPQDKLGSRSLADAGRILFATQGCLACHRHRDFPEGTSDVGPDLSDLGQRLVCDTGRQWLRLWLTSPQTLSPSTRMPQPQFRDDAWIYRVFEPAESKPRRVTSSEVIDALVAFLLSGESSTNGSQQPEKLPVNAEWLDEVVLEYLSSDLPREKAQGIVRNGATVADLGKYSLQVALELTELLGEPTSDKKLRYVGRKAIGRYGCYGCHDISGFEGWPPIGPSLSQFGSKPVALLDFGAVAEGLLSTPEGRHIVQRRKTPLEDRLSSLDFLGRETWLWLKLISPRAFDFKAMEGKPILQHSRMGRFPLSGEERQAIMAFILGLEGRPVPPKYDPYSASRKALALGREIIERRACDRCHALRPEQWFFRFSEEDVVREMGGDYDPIGRQTEAEKASAMPPRRPLGYALAMGQAERDASGQIIEDRDDFDNPLYFFMPWRPVAFGAHIWPVGEASIPIASTQLLGKRDQDGGAFAFMLYPTVVSLIQQIQLSMGLKETMGCLPPPLYYEGVMVQPSWLSQYLKEPYPIRPAIPLAMPRYWLTNEEVQILVDYFSALAEKTGESDTSWKTTETQLILREQQWPGRLDAAWHLIHDTKTYCAKCHISSDNMEDRLALPTEAPRLDGVYRRLQHDFIRAWVVQPKAIRPYTAMPVNFPENGIPLDRSVFDADSRVQLEAVVDLLQNYDWYLKQRVRQELGPAQSQ